MLHHIPKHKGPLQQWMHCAEGAQACAVAAKHTSDERFARASAALKESVPALAAPRYSNGVPNALHARACVARNDRHEIFHFIILPADVAVRPTESPSFVAAVLQAIVDVAGTEVVEAADGNGMWLNLSLTLLLGCYGIMHADDHHR